MALLPLLAFLLAITSTQAQTNICYANCQRGYCLANNSLSCTSCDPGLQVINSQCIATNIQPQPLTYLKPNPSNTLLDSISAPVCSITSNTISTRMLFQPILGNSFTQQFSIPTSYNYLRIKFNAILLSANIYSTSLSLLINVVPATSLNTFLISQTESINPLGTSVTCNTNIANRGNHYGVYFMDYKVSANDPTVIVQVLPQGVTQTYIAVSNFQIYYGSCHQTCATCVGPTNAECNSCRGLLTNLTNGTCSNCPQGFYQNVTCRPCPPACRTCQLDFNQVNCTQCLSFPGITYTIVNGSCVSNQSNYTSLTGPTFGSLWTASQRPSNPYSSCGSYLLLGGISIGIANSYFRYIVTNLPVHSNVYLTFNLLLIDQNPQNSYHYGIGLDSQNLTSQPVIIPISGTDQCGGTGIEYLKQESYTFSHTASTATVTIYIYQSYMGIRDFQLLVDNPTTDADCLTYVNNTCLLCRNGLVVENNTCTGCLAGYYKSNNSCLACPVTCSHCQLNNQQVICTACREPLVLESTYCVDSNNALHSSELLPDLSLANQDIVWSYYPNLQNRGIATCGSAQFIGSSTIQFKFLTMRRQFTNLPQHRGVVLYFILYQIDGNYFDSNALSFTLNGQNYTSSNIPNLSTLNTLRSDLCGNSTQDSRYVLQLKDTSHTESTLDFAVNLASSGKIGISDVQLYLLNGVTTGGAPFEVQTMPAYSVSTPAVKGLEVRLIFPRKFVSSNIQNAFIFEIQPPTSTARLLVQGYSNDLLTINRTIASQEIYYLLNYSYDLNNSQQLVVRAAAPDSVIYPGSNGQYHLAGQQAVSTQITRYVDIPESSIGDRSSLRNLFNLFRGCAILALFIGLVSFLVGMSAAFDDFFILCQLIFVHIFIQMEYNPPSLRIPFTGLHIVQFLEWLPSAARTSIESGILPANLYQPCSLIFQQYYEDVAFARTVYHAILFIGLTLVIWVIIHVFLLIYDSRHPNEQAKYNNFFVYYYKQYNSKVFVFVDKVARFCYFTFAWSCILQLLFFSNQPSGFHTWNSILTVVIFILVIIFPVVMFGLLRRGANSLSDLTFNVVYEDVRINKERIWYYLFRYYKLFLIAIVVAVTYSSSPVIPLIILIILHIIDFGLIFAMKPLGMEQPDLVGAYMFYPKYPKVYHYTMLIQQILFILLEIFWLILFGIRNSADSGTYMGIGYTICAFVILLLLNGLFRLIWGILKILQYCYLERQANYLSVEKLALENKDGVDDNLIMNQLRTQNQLSRRDLTSRMFTNKRASYVSKIR